MLLKSNRLLFCCNELKNVKKKLLKFIFFFFELYKINFNVLVEKKFKFNYYTS